MLDRVADHVEVDEQGCHIWTGFIDASDGRPRMAVGSVADGTRRVRRVHQVVWIETHGEVPEGSDVHHTCENRRCVNPEHLVLLEHGEHSAHHHAKGSEAEMKRMSHALHVRWHERRGIVKPDCPWCGA